MKVKIPASTMTDINAEKIDIIAIQPVIKPLTGVKDSPLLKEKMGLASLIFRLKRLYCAGLDVQI